MITLCNFSRHGQPTRLHGKTLRNTSLGLLFALFAPYCLATPVCTVASGANLLFGNVPALVTTPDQYTNSGSSFWVNCSADVATEPTLYAPGTLSMASGANQLPFQLSLDNFATVLSNAAPGTSLAIPLNGSNQTVTLYGRILAAQFKSLPAGSYAASVTLVLNY